jgi:multiple sugar transport system substrate-binding protein
MKKIALSLALCGVVASSAVAEKTVVEISYSYPKIFKEVHKTLEKEFEKKFPNIDVKIRPGTSSYEEETQKTLRQSITNKMPDISFQGLNRFRIFADKKLAVDLNTLMKEDKQNLDAIGFNESLYGAGKFGDKVYGVPFAVSLPIGYYNMDLVKKAGWDVNNLPKTWSEAIDLANKINALEKKNVKGMFFNWQITGNWFWQALNFSQGGSMLSADEKKIAFDGKEGQWAINTLKSFTQDAKMPFISKYSVARTDFIAGNLGAYYSSTSDINAISDAIGGNFEMKTAIFPSIKKDGGKLPAGGNGAVILTKDPKKQKAAYEVIKFWCGPEGSKVVANMTGYMPPNQVAAKQLTDEGFYKNNPNNATAVKTLPYMTGWYAFPGKNSLKITEVIYDHMESIVNGKETDTAKVLNSMAKEVQKKLPR